MSGYMVLVVIIYDQGILQWNTWTYKKPGMSHQYGESDYCREHFVYMLPNHKDECF